MPSVPDLTPRKESHEIKLRRHLKEIIMRAELRKRQHRSVAEIRKKNFAGKVHRIEMQPFPSETDADPVRSGKIIFAVVAGIKITGRTVSEESHAVSAHDIELQFTADIVIGISINFD